MGKRIDFGPYEMPPKELKLIGGGVYIVREKGFKELNYLFCGLQRAIRIDSQGGVHYDNLDYYKTRYEVIAEVTERITIGLS